MFYCGVVNVASKGWNKSMGDFWNYQIRIGNVKAKPMSGNCMFCNEAIKETDDDHSVCNKCWIEKIGDEND